MMSLGPCFFASPSSAALPFSHFVAAPVPTPRAAARGGGPGCRGGGCHRRCPLAVVVPVPSLVSSPFPRRRPALLVSSHNPPHEQLLVAVVGGAVVVVVMVVVVPVAILVSLPFSPPCPVV